MNICSTVIALCKHQSQADTVLLVQFCKLAYRSQRLRGIGPNKAVAVGVETKHCKVEKDV